MSSTKNTPVKDRRKNKTSKGWLKGVIGLEVIVIFGLLLTFWVVDTRSKSTTTYTPEEREPVTHEFIADTQISDTSSPAPEEVVEEIGPFQIDPEVSKEEALQWVETNSSFFSENQVLTARDNENFAIFLYRWKNLEYDTTESSEIELTRAEQETGIPHFLQWDDRWGYYNYGEEVIGTSGCGPTCMAMVAAGLLKIDSINPQTVADYATANDLYMWGTGTMWDIYEEYSAYVGITCTDLVTDMDLMLQELRAGHTVIVSVRRGIFTYGGHFIVLTGIDEEGNITINDPMSIERSSRTWQLSEFRDQIKNAWSFYL